MVRFSSFTSANLLIAILLVVVEASGASRSFKCVTWNVNGVQKLRSDRNVLAFLARFDVVLLQETYSGSSEDVLNLEDFIPNHQWRVPRLEGQNGVSQLFFALTLLWAA